ncbi:MAG: hypothetical protein RQ899_11405 [Pseudomonadales bacterium]|nr:hypothetical protein [Pseudomonadales bacterium]
MFTCKHFARHANVYLETELPPVLHLRFTMHRMICRNCRRYLNQMRQVARLAMTMFPAALPDPVEESLLRAFRERQQRHSEHIFIRHDA